MTTRLKGSPNGAKLTLLQQAACKRFWRSLDDKRHCILCEQTISGHQIRVQSGKGGALKLACPTEGCPGTPAEWIHPGNPLLSEEAWQDWTELLTREELPDPVPRGGI